MKITFDLEKQNLFNLENIKFGTRIFISFLIFILFFPACSPGVMPTIQKKEITPTNIPSTSTPIPVTPTPSKYSVQEPDIEFTPGQKAINASDSATEQKERMKQWLDYWVKFENRPFPLQEVKISWKYIYDNLDNPTEVLVLLETAGGDYGNKEFSAPIADGIFIDYPPQEEDDYLQTNLEPLELSANRGKDWLSVDNGVPVRRGSDNKILEKMNMQTATWEILSKTEMALHDTEMQFIELGISLDSPDFTLSQDEGGVITVVDNNRKVEIYNDGKFNYDFIYWYLQHNCDQTNIKPIQGRNFPEDRDLLFNYFDNLGYDLAKKAMFTPTVSSYILSIKDTKYCWALAGKDEYLKFRDKEKNVHRILVNELTMRHNFPGTWK
jgi:hypothetical protein